MKNEYEIRGDVTAIIINSPKYGRQEALISSSKLDRIKEFPNSWHVDYSKRTRSFYARGHLPREKGKTKQILLHRWITNAPEGTIVDHYDHDTLNNTDSNLREATYEQNGQNRKFVQSNNTSGVRGVCLHKGTNKWLAKVGVGNKKIYLGLFKTIEEAEQAVIGARMHHMPYSQEASL